MTHRRVPWTRQPQYAAGINKGNPFARGLILALLPSSGRFNIVTGQELLVVGAGINPTGFSPAGRTFRGTTSAADRLEFTPPVALTAGTILAVTSHSSAVPGGSLWHTNSTQSDFAPFASDSLLYFNTWASSRYINGVAFPSSSSFSRYVVCARGSSVANSHAAFIDGRQIGSTNSAFVVDSSIRIGANGFNGGTNAALYLLWDRALSDKEVAEISGNPWQVFQPRRIWVPVSVAGGGAAALEASVSASASVSAALTTAIQCAASVSATATASAALTTAIRPAASVSATATASAALTTAIRPAASVTATATVSAALTTSIRLASSVTASATASAELVGGAAALASSVSASASVSASLTTAVRLASAVTATAQATAALTTAIQLQATATASASASADLTTASGTIAAAVIATAQASAALTTAIAMQAVATAQATAAANLQVGDEVSVVQPYITVYLWKRTA